MICYVKGLKDGAVCVTPEVARELVEQNIIRPLAELGHFVLDTDELSLWAVLRKVKW